MTDRSLEVFSPNICRTICKKYIVNDHLIGIMQRVYTNKFIEKLALLLSAPTFYNYTQLDKNFSCMILITTRVSGLAVKKVKLL